MDIEVETFLRERNRVMRELDIAGGKRILNRPDADDETVLVALHKARIMWRGASDLEVAVSTAWLKERGYSAPERGPFVG